MQEKRLTRDFFERKTLTVAKDLVGAFLVRQMGNKTIVAMITETEAYCGPYDLASHAAKGRTKRTEVMFGQAGVAYVYMIYGMYFCLNIVTEKIDYPAAVLIRGVRLVPDESLARLNGPGKLCRFLDITKDLNGEDCITSEKLWLEDHGVRVSRSQIQMTPRIGIDYAGAYRDKPWRFVLKGT